MLAAPAVRGRAAESATVAEAFDAEMEAFMGPRGVPGGALAVVKNRRLVYAKGYGLADRERKLPVTPDALFRIASISKPFTGVAVLQLVEAGRLRLEDRAFSLLGFDPSQAADPCVAQIQSALPGQTLPDGVIDAALHRAAGRVGAWPEGIPFDGK